MFAPTISHPMVDDFSLRAARQTSRAQPPGVPAQYNLPLRHHPMWSGNNELGRDLPFAIDANNRQSILKLEEWGPPAMWTVHLGMSFTALNRDVSPPTNDNFAVTALVEFGAGGVMQQAEIDWLNGATFTAAFNALNITAVYDNPTSIPADLHLRASIGVGGPATPPSRTLVFSPALVTALGGTSFVPIPPFAKRAMVIGGQASPTGPNLLYDNAVKYVFARQSGSAGRIAVFYGTEMLAFAPNGVPVPPLAQVLYVENNAASDLPSPRVVFELAF